MQESASARPALALSGATGAVGGLVAQRLAERGIPLRLVVRDPTHAPSLPASEIARASYDEPAALREALRGIHTWFMVSAHETADRAALQCAAVDAAVAAGVERIVYLSFMGAAPEATFTFARDHWATEQRIRESGRAFTFLRDCLYQDILPYLPGPDGVIRGPAGDGRVAAVARADIAAAVVAVLRGEDHVGATYELTGPEALRLAEIAEELSRVSGCPLRYQAETLEEAFASRAGYGAPDWEVAGWVTSYAAIAGGELAQVSPAVEELTGQSAISFAEFLRQHPEIYQHLRPA